VSEQTRGCCETVSFVGDKISKGPGNQVQKCPGTQTLIKVAGGSRRHWCCNTCSYRQPPSASIGLTAYVQAEQEYRLANAAIHIDECIIKNCQHCVGARSLLELGRAAESFKESLKSQGQSTRNGSSDMNTEHVVKWARWVAEANGPLYFEDSPSDNQRADAIVALADENARLLARFNTKRNNGCDATCLNYCLHADHGFKKEIEDKIEIARGCIKKVVADLNEINEDLR
jgi:hypothetical protein